MSASMSLTQSAPPLAHAIGGSLGSALALMLLYPLERAKIEMQAQASQRRSSRHPQQHLQNFPPLHVESNLNKAMAVETALADSPTGDSGSYVMVSSIEDTTRDDLIADDDGRRLAVQLNVSDHSQVHIERPPELSESSPDLSPTSSNEKGSSSPSSVGLVACLARLWERGELYRGITPVVSTISISNFIFFYVNEFMKKLFFTESSSHSKQQKLTLSLLASSLAGVANVVATNPLWVANLRVISGGRKLRQSSVWLEMIRIAREEGFLQLWNGTLASLLLISNPVIQFFFYDLLKNGRITQKKKRLQLLQTSKNNKMLSAAGRLSPWEAFLLGAIAKAISTILTYPLQLAQAVLRLQQKPSECDSSTTSANQAGQALDDESHIEYHGTLDCLCKLYNSGGMEGLFTGIKAKLLQTVLTAAFTFLTYEQIVQAIQLALTRP